MVPITLQEPLFRSIATFSLSVGVDFFLSQKLCWRQGIKKGVAVVGGCLYVPGQNNHTETVNYNTA